MSMMVRTTTLRRAMLIAMACMVALLTQSASPLAQMSFDVISIRPTPENTRNARRFIALPGGRFSGSRIPLAMIVDFVYRFPQERVFGLPQWAHAEFFEIEARGTWESPPTIDELKRMLGQMLADRFALRVHTEKRESDVFALVLARGRRTTGPSIRPADGRCEARAAAKEEIPLPTFPAPGRRPDCGIAVRVVNGVRQLRLGSGTIASLISQTQAKAVLGRDVVDRSGLSGLFDIELDYVPEQPLLADPRETKAAVAGPSLAEAMRDQLGLAFERTKALVEVLVVDRVQRPTAN
jgi:uncharacterized protein (TIGR03435 family)